MRHTREGTEVELRLALESRDGKNEAVIRVADRGPGVPKEALDKLFRPFYRLDTARDRQTGGVGLGLAITERAVRLHGGTVSAANRPEGGLMVEIRLPIGCRPPSRHSAKLEARKPQAGHVGNRPDVNFLETLANLGRNLQATPNHPSDSNKSLRQFALPGNS